MPSEHRRREQRGQMGNLKRDDGKGQRGKLKSDKGIKGLRGEIRLRFKKITDDFQKRHITDGKQHL